MTTKPDRKTHGMKAKILLCALAFALLACAHATGGEHGRADPGGPHILQRWHPVGGWHPDAGGALHWWNPHCFPRCGGPDDYCRKPPPKVCWPPYPPFYLWGTPHIGAP